jgi:hypothetical protein
MSGLNFIAAAILVGGAVVGGGSAVLQVILPAVPPIQVQSLVYGDGIIHQTRTVTAPDGGVFWAQFHAQVIDTNTGKPAPFCDGSGSWNYKAGSATYDIPLPEWVGDARCTPESLPSSCFRPVATWFWGTDQTSHAGKEWCKE